MNFLENNKKGQPPLPFFYCFQSFNPQKFQLSQSQKPSKNANFGCPSTFSRVPIGFRGVPVRFQGVQIGFSSVPVGFKSVQVGFNNVPFRFKSVQIKCHSVPVGFQSVQIRCSSVPKQKTPSPGGEGAGGEVAAYVCAFFFGLLNFILVTNFVSGAFAPNKPLT